MSTIQDLFQQAQLAEAAYANFFSNSGVLLTSNADVIAALQDQSNSMSFSQTQANDFVAHWRVVSHIPNTLSGFSATELKGSASHYFWSQHATSPTH